MSDATALPKLVLASRSPRRRQILNELGIQYLAVSVESEEHLDSLAPIEEEVQRLALEKAEVAAWEFTSHLILAADTLVRCGGRVFGKPTDMPNARETLEFLQGKTHEIFTGVALLDSSTRNFHTDYGYSKLEFRQQNQEEIERFIQMVDPLDKAGGYTVDGPGALLVESIHGCFYNILGLPVTRLDDLFGSLGFDIFDFHKKTVSEEGTP